MQQEQLKYLPRKHVKFDVTQLNIDKAFTELNKIVVYPEDPVWDGGFYSIQEKGNEWSGNCWLYLFDPLEKKPRDFQPGQVDHILDISEEIKTLFNFIKEYYQELNPNQPFDALFVTVHPDQRHVINFEFEGNEVFLTAPPAPKEINEVYLLQNLFNCLTHQAPENYEWAWAIINRGRNSEGYSESSGSYFYSLQPDKGAAQPLQPGEEVFMQNVTMKLFDDFIDKRKSQLDQSTGFLFKEWKSILRSSGKRK